MRPSIDSDADRLAGIFDDVAGAAGGADLADDGEDDVLGGDAAGSWPSTRTSMFFAFFWISVWVASTCSTSDVPMPCASAPKAPCVEVWLSPQTMVMPGRVKPCSGPTMWTMPWRTSFSEKYSMPKSTAFLASVSTWMRLSSFSMPMRAVRRGRHVVVGHRQRALGVAHLAAASSAAPRRPAGWSPRAPDGGRCRAGRCRRPGGAPRAGRRSCRKVCWARSCLEPLDRAVDRELRAAAGGRHVWPISLEGWSAHPTGA